MTEQLNPVTPYVAHGLLALFGAFVHAAKSHREGESKTVVDFLVLMIMSSFSGVMFALIGLETFGEASYLTLAMAGTGGFIGVEGMTYVIQLIRNRLFPGK